VKAALLGLGWKPAIVRPALAEAIAALEADATFDQLLREALRRCPRRCS
jgi:Holliday junction resolvasome RuvABC DNA-binding subunit